MKTIESRLNDLEGKLTPNANAILFIADLWDDVVDGYFKNVEEKKAYEDWRAKMVREENKYNPARVFVYWFDEKDVLKYLQEFRKFYFDR